MALIHNLLLKKAKAANYSALEVEEIQRMQEEVLIQYYLDKESNQVLNDIEIQEEELEQIFKHNSERYEIEERVKLDTIFIQDPEKAKKILEKTDTKNFQRHKKKYDEKEETILEWVGISKLHPSIYDAVKHLKKDKLAQECVEVEDGAHIVYLLDREFPRTATYEEAKNFLLSELQWNVFQNIKKQLIDNIVQEEKKIEYISEEKGGEKT